MRTHLLAAALAAALCVPASSPAFAAQSSSAAHGSSAESGQRARNVPNAAEPTDYTASMARLQDAAQRFREAIQAMAQRPAGDRRSEAIRTANRALFDTQRAMMELPPEMWTGTGTASHPNETKAMDRLQQAAQQLRDAVQAIAQRPAGEQRNEAIDTANHALLEAQEAMVLLPPAWRAGHGARNAAPPAEGGEKPGT